MEVEEAALRKRIEHQEDEIVRLHDTIEDQTASIDNLNVRFGSNNSAGPVLKLRSHISDFWLKPPPGLKGDANSLKRYKSSSVPNALQSCSRPSSSPSRGTSCAMLLIAVKRYVE
jgi:hypothetical protein